jgi:hypothetical protein
MRRHTGLAARLVLALIAAGLAGTAYGQDAAKAHVGVMRFANETNSPSYDAACKAATDTLALTLQQLGRYLVQSEDASGGGEDALRALAEEQHLDFVMYGKMAKTASGSIDCSLSVYDRAKGKTTLSRTGTAAGVLDIFDAADDLVVSVLETMTGSHIGFGSLRLTNAGEKGSYAVLVDGSEVGKDLASVDKLLNGRRTVTIEQKRMLGEREIAKAVVEVKEGETSELRFAVPLLMDDERQKVEGLEAAIRTGWDTPGAAGEVDAETAELGSLFGDLSYSPSLTRYRDEAKQLAGEWGLRKGRMGIEAAAWGPKAELLDAAGSIYAGAKAYPDPRKIRDAFEEEAQLEATLIELEAGKALGDGDIDAGLECFEDALMLSTRYLGGARLTDYAYAVTTLKDFQEKSGAGGAGSGGQDMKTVFGALIRAGQAFYGLRDQVESGKACLLVASDVGTQLSVDGSAYAAAPLALPPVAGTRSVSVQAKGGTAVSLTAEAGARLLFVRDGYAPFGKVTIGYVPGSISVSVDQEGAVASLDGEDDVPLPHLFDNVAPGEHKVTIRDVPIVQPYFNPDLAWLGVKEIEKIYAGLDASVTVEPGRQAKLHTDLEVGRAKLRVNGIPQGSALLIDGETCPLKDDAEGLLFYDGEVDAGTTEIEILHGNVAWVQSSILQVNSSITYTPADLVERVTLQRQSIKFKGQDDDFAGIEPIFQAFPNNLPIPTSGSVVAGGSICRDDKYLYCKIDFSNGKPAWPNGSSRSLRLAQGEQLAYLEAARTSAGPMQTDIQVNGKSQFAIGSSYVDGPSFTELKFPLSSLSKNLDFSKPMKAWLTYWSESGNHSQSSPLFIMIGK